MTLMKICRCGKIISIAESHCVNCQERKTEKEQDRVRYKHYDKHKRDKQSTDFYNSKPWRLTKKAALDRDNYLCVHCLSRSKTTAAEEVDHIIPIKVDWTKRLSTDNLQSLCCKCHRVKTRADKLKYKELNR